MEKKKSKQKKTRKQIILFILRKLQMQRLVQFTENTTNKLHRGHVLVSEKV